MKFSINFKTNGGAMTKNKNNALKDEMKALFSQDTDFLKTILENTIQDILNTEMDIFLGAVHHERSETRRGYRAGSYSRALITRIGKIELRVPRDREGRFSTQIFERYQRAEKALVSALAEMYIQGVSTRKVKAITEELCGHEFSSSTISNINASLDKHLKAFACRRLEEAFPYLILDARYEKVRVDGVVSSQAVLIAIGIDYEGKRHILGVELASRESTSSWKTFLESLVERGLHGVDFVVSDNHPGLKRAIREMLIGAVWQRCYVHFLRNALDYLPRKADDDCMQELRWIYDRKNLSEARKALKDWQIRWEAKYSKLCNWVEEHIEETLSFYMLPRQHHKHLKSTNMLERLNEEIRRRTYVLRIFPNEASCLRLIRALCIEQHEEWIEDKRYVNMDFYKEEKKLKLEAMENAA